jgi:enamine deaminase RidA (YjgF/YER057c/UK114 family)
MRQPRRHLRRRGLLLSGAATGLGALAAGSSGALAQQSEGAGGIQWLDYEPPRPFAAGARIGNVVYLSGEASAGADIVAQTQGAFQNVQKSLTALGSDLQHIFKMTVYLVNMADQPAFAQVRSQFLPRPVASTVVAVSRLVPPDGLVEIDVMALVPET